MGEKPGFDLDQEPTAEAFAKVNLVQPLKVIETVHRKGEDERDVRHQELRWSIFSEPFRAAYDLYPDGSSQKQNMLALLQDVERLGPTMKAVLYAHVPEDKIEDLDLELLGKSADYRNALVEEYGNLPEEVGKYVRTIKLLETFKREVEQEYGARELAKPMARGEDEYWEEPPQEKVSMADIERLRKELAEETRKPLPVNDMTGQALEGMIQEVQGVADNEERQQQVAELATQAADMMSTLSREDIGTPLYERLLAAQTDLTLLSDYT